MSADTQGATKANYVQVGPNIEELITEECDKLKELLISKNRKYGNSALNPKRICSKADPLEQIKVRMDDKLSRIDSQQIDDDEDAYTDLAGYIILMNVWKRINLPLNLAGIEVTDWVTTSTTDGNREVYWDMNKGTCCDEGSDTCGRDGDKTPPSDQSNE